MNNIYKNKLKVQYSSVDKHLNLKLFCTANFVQNNMTNLFGQMNVANEWLKEHHGAFWVVSKLKIHFDRRIVFGDELLSESFMSNCSKARLNITHNFSSVDDNSSVFTAHQELCAMDVVTRKVRSIGSIINAKDVIKDKISFSKYRWNIEEFTKIYGYTIMYDDIDSNGHVNNARYLSFVVNALGSEFFDKNRVTDIELHYINECIEGTHINVYKKSFDGTVLVIIMSGQNEVLKAKLMVESLQ